MHLITGHSGSAHITSANDGAVNAHVFGGGSYVFDTREKFAATIISATEVQIESGEGLHNGRYFEIAKDTHERVSIDTGSIGINRIDLIAARYSINGESGIETMQLVTIKGTPAQNPVAPAFNSASVLDGATVSDYPLYKVTIEGITLKSLEPLFTIRRDIVNDVVDSNAATVEEIRTSNAQTVAAVTENNANTLAEIKAENATTKTEIAENNAQTVAEVKQNNAETLVAIDEKIESVLTCDELWVNPNGGTFVDTDITHPSIEGYKYIEYIYGLESYFDGENMYETYSSGKLPVTNGKAYTYIKYSDVGFSMYYGIGNYIAVSKRQIATSGSTTFTSRETTTTMRVSDKSLETSKVENIVDSSARELVLLRILGYKPMSTAIIADEEDF